MQQIPWINLHTKKLDRCAHPHDLEIGVTHYRTPREVMEPKRPHFGNISHATVGHQSNGAQAREGCGHDFAAMGRAFGLDGEIITRTEEFRPALERSLASSRSTLLELRIDPEAITPSATLSGLRAAALKKTTG